MEVMEDPCGDREPMQLAPAIVEDHVAMAHGCVRSE